MKQVLLEDIADLNMGLVLARRKSQEKTPFSYRLLSLKAFDEDYIKDEFIDEFYATQSLENHYLVRENDIVIRLRLPLKAHVINQNEFLISSHMLKITLKDTKAFNPYFVAEIINHSRLENLAEGQALRLLNVKDIKSITIPYIEIDRQNKFANIFKTINERKQTLNELITKEETLKTIILKEILNG
ncbi:restriction endonuclease subunit S [Campylobacter sp. RM12647]|uniref:restriction endonuclease subunit S n=1 Tax=Campylobacter sp. RM12647 TaxID=2735737 RepID=UPI001D6800F6|nr:restriction endonuclease subunit S [Campylobacter sp. RM12647]